MIAALFAAVTISKCGFPPSASIQPCEAVSPYTIGALCPMDRGSCQVPDGSWMPDAVKVALTKSWMRLEDCERELPVVQRAWRPEWGRVSCVQQLPITVSGHGNIVEDNITVDACPVGGRTRTLRDDAGNVHVICLSHKPHAASPNRR